MNNNTLNRSIHKIAALAICSTPLWVNPALAVNLGIEKMVIFGDSLNDVNNLSSLTGGYPPAPYYDPGRFSNGRVWVEYLQEQMNLKNPTLSYYQYITSSQTSRSQPIDVSNVGWNYAIGGSTTDGHLDPRLDPSVGLLGQMETYKGLMQMSGATVDPETLYIIWSGNNDYIGLTPEDFIDPTSAIQKTVSNVLQSVESLAEMGAKNITVANLANLGDTPIAAIKSEELGIDLVSGLNTITGIHNDLLALGISNLRSKYSDINFIELDMHHLVSNILDHPEDKGLIDEVKTKSCTNIDDVPNLPEDFVVCDDPNAYVFWDNQHPVTKVHKWAANYALKEIRAIKGVPEPSTVGTLGLLGFGLLWRMKQKRN